LQGQEERPKVNPIFVRVMLKKQHISGGCKKVVKYLLIMLRLLCPLAYLKPSCTFELRLYDADWLRNEVIGQLKVRLAPARKSGLSPFGALRLLWSLRSHPTPTVCSCCSQAGIHCVTLEVQEMHVGTCPCKYESVKRQSSFLYTALANR